MAFAPKSHEHLNPEWVENIVKLKDYSRASLFKISLSWPRFIQVPKCVKILDVIIKWQARNTKGSAIWDEYYFRIMSCQQWNEVDYNEKY